MVYINHEHQNNPAPPGTFGGAMCVCPECSHARNVKAGGLSPGNRIDHRKFKFTDDVKLEAFIHSLLDGQEQEIIRLQRLLDEMKLNIEALLKLGHET